MSRMNPICQCEECGVDLAYPPGTMALCPPCYDRCFSFVYSSEEEEPQEVA